MVRKKVDAVNDPKEYRGYVFMHIKSTGELILGPKADVLKVKKKRLKDESESYTESDFEFLDFQEKEKAWVDKSLDGEDVVKKNNTYKDIDW